MRVDFRYAGVIEIPRRIMPQANAFHDGGRTCVVVNGKGLDFFKSALLKSEP